MALHVSAQCGASYVDTTAQPLRRDGFERPALVLGGSAISADPEVARAGPAGLTAQR
jgi:hypothetical protein